MSVVVLLVLVTATLGLFLSLRAIVNDEQSRLLQDHAKEAGTVVESLFQNVGVSLPSLAKSAPATSASQDEFAASADPYLGFVLSYIGALKLDATGGYQVATSVGNGPGPGTLVAPDRARLAGLAANSNGLVQSRVATPNGRRMSFALKAEDGTVLIEDLSFDSAKPIDLGKSGPFSELNGAFYASPGPDPASLVMSTTGRLPLRGRVSRQPLNVGDQHWSLVVSSRGSLIGSFASNAPWWALGGGLALALAVTLLVESVGRRRSYALALVDERTRDLNEAREAAETANRAKSEFLSRMSHELRTPLNAVLGFSQLLQLDDLTVDQSESVEQIVKGGRHLLGLINDVLDISSIEAGRLAFSPEAVSVSGAIEDVMMLIRPLAAERGVVLSSRASDSPDHYLLADRQRLQQILLNLVSNAVKYSGAGAVVTLYTENFEPHSDGSGGLPGLRSARIVVADTGPGIRDEDLAKLFTPFERLGAEATGIEGTGVGLSLSQRLAEAMGGTVGVSSVFGEGSRFWVELPVSEAPLERYERSHVGHGPGGDVPNSANRLKVLYIEDNPSNLRLVERVVETHTEFDLVVAMHGRLGIELAREHLPAVILLDLHLPDIGGEEVLRELRKDPATSETPVIILSADATPGRSERLIASGASSFLTKPIDVATLIRTLDEYRDRSADGVTPGR